eukprot:COSAG06_NODE_73369_length_159_cov_2.366667_1_plen_35_part_01
MSRSALRAHLPVQTDQQPVTPMVTVRCWVLWHAER